MAGLISDADRRAFVEVGRRLGARGFVAANDGNLSVRLDDDRVAITAAGSITGFLTDEDLVVIDGRGELVAGGRRPSSERAMHLAIYEERQDVRAIVHAHPPTATGFAAAGVPMEEPVLPEVVAILGTIRTAPYATPSTSALADAVRPVVGDGAACLLANHGAVAYGADLFDAYHHLERVEHAARILLVARQLGGARTLSPGEVAELRALGASAAPAPDSDDDALIEAAVREVRRRLNPRG